MCLQIDTVCLWTYAAFQLFSKGAQFISSISSKICTFLSGSFMTDGSKHAGHRMGLPGIKRPPTTAKGDLPPSDARVFSWLKKITALILT